jgi:hypothetical protein
MRAYCSIPVRLLCATASVAFMAVSLTTSVSAKGLPYFTVEVTPATPLADEPIRIVVRTWVDVEHTNPARFDAVSSLDGLLVIRSPDRETTDIPVPLRLREPDRFEGSVTLPAGDWILVAFPDRSGWATPEVSVGNPDTIALTVREAGPNLPVEIALVAMALLAVAGYSLNRLRSAALTRSSSVEFTPTSASAARDASRASPIE